MKVAELAGVIAVRTRLMKAVFFFKEESRDLLTSNKSGRSVTSALVGWC